MKLLFKEETFSDSLKDLIGHVDSDIKFRSLKSDLRSATKEMIKLIGQPLYAKVLTAFNKTTQTEADKELVYHVQYPIAINAFRLSLPTSDLQHTPNGRFMRSDDHEKSPFPWMIDRDDKSQERKYYRALDDLLNFLDDENITDWKSSDAYKAQKQYFVNSTDDFDEYFPIDSRLLLLKLLPGIRQAERKHILALIGKSKFDQMKTDFQAGSINADDKPLFKLIKEACVYYTLAWAMKRLTATLFPEGVLQQYVSDKMLNPKKTPAKMESQLAFQEFHKDAMDIFKEIEVLVTPEPTTTETPPDDTDPYDFGFTSDDKFATT